MRNIAVSGSKKLLVSSMVAMLLAMPLGAQPIAYNFSWVGEDGYSMLGSFSFDEASAADGAVRNAEVLSLTFEAFLNGISIRSNSTAHTQGDFNFNFDATAEQFFLGGSSFGTEGQRWNFQTLSGLGFSAGNFSSLLSIPEDDALGELRNPSTLVATRVVPEPSSMALLSLALGAIGVVSRRRTQRRV